ncbi:MAG: tripartite tricarboxylate transporter substrate binding protein [Burkholderiales bacterium]|nr:tripartite tricarboxylate transporter substrate binding protein [Burkholderiales bacterium]
MRAPPLAILFAAACPLAASAQAFPTKPIRIVVPFAAGGPADITTRTVAPRLTELLGQPIVVDNRAGASGIIGTEAVIRAAPDGHTLLMATASVSAINMVTYAKPPYDTLRDLQPLTPVMTTSSLIVVHPSVPARTLKELVALARARPGQIAFGSAGVGGTLHLGLEMLMKEAKVKINHVPYKGAAPAVVDVVAGQITGMFVDLPVISPYVRDGRVRALATANPARTQHFPDIPTAKEAGFANVEMTNSYSLLAPARTPRETVARLHDAIVKAVGTPAVREKLLANGSDPLTLSVEEFTAFIRKDIEKWGRLVRETGIQLER